MSSKLRKLRERPVLKAGGCAGYTQGLFQISFREPEAERGEERDRGDLAQPIVE